MLCKNDKHFFVIYSKVTVFQMERSGGEVVFTLLTLDIFSLSSRSALTQHFLIEAFHI